MKQQRPYLNESNYFASWATCIAKPLLQYNTTLLEAQLTPSQIENIFKSIENSTSFSKTALGTGLAVANALLPTNLTEKLHELIKDTRAVKAFDASFNDLKTKILSRHPDLSKTIDNLGALVKKHPIMGAAVIGVLTTVAALVSGGASAIIVGILLRTSKDLIIGETLSYSLSKGVGVGLLGWLTAMPIRELAAWLSHFSVNAITVPGYTNLVKSTFSHMTNGVADLNVTAWMTTDMHRKVEKLLDIAHKAFADNNYDRAADIYRNIKSTFSDPNYISKINQLLANNKELASAALSDAKNAANAFTVIASAIQGGVTGAAKNKLDEADVKSVVSAAADWAKSKAARSAVQFTRKFTVEKFMKIWSNAGKPTDSDMIEGMLSEMGVPDKVIKAAIAEVNKLPTSDTASGRAVMTQIKTGNAELDDKINKMIAEKGKAYAIRWLKTQHAKHSGAATPVTIKTGNADLDKKVNDILQSQGKEAAVKYIKNLQSVSKVVKPVTRTPIKVGGEIIKPSDPRYDQIMKLYKGDVSESQSVAKNIVINEAKARIDHPEDLIIDDGVAGAKQALAAMISLANQPNNVTVKFDGSPALIFGWDDNGFVLTDKSGFGAKGYDGLTRSAEDLRKMLRGDTGRRIADTSPEGMRLRDQYASSIAGIYEYLKAMVPKTFSGYLQGDLMWKDTPAIKDNAYVFKPVKVLYSIPVDSSLGKQIAASKYGIVIHSVFGNRDDAEPRSVTDVRSLGLNQIPEVVVIPHQISIQRKLELPAQAVKSLESAINAGAASINQFFDGNIKSLQPLMKSYLAWKAGKGSDDYSNSAEEFVVWLDSDASKTTDSMRSKVKEHISKNVAGYSIIWQIIDALNKLKLHLKKQLDSLAAGTISAELHGEQGHEGFVADTPDSKIKLVNRAKFMKKDEPVAESASSGGTGAGSIASIVNPMGGVISRTPNLFGYIPYAVQTKSKKKKRKGTT